MPFARAGKLLMHLVRKSGGCGGLWFVKTAWYLVLFNNVDKSTGGFVIFLSGS